MKLIGYERNDFATKTGEKITGYNLYLSRNIDPSRGAGIAVERIYVTVAKLDASGIDLAEAVDKNVVIFYNRYGKLARIAIDD